MHSCASLKNQKMYLKCQLGTLTFDTYTQKIVHTKIYVEIYN